MKQFFYYFIHGSLDLSFEEWVAVILMTVITFLIVSDTKGIYESKHKVLTFFRLTIASLILFRTMAAVTYCVHAGL